MDKNWLIRTKSNHILGPVSKEKVLELFNNGSIKNDDEVCSGNGYWFFIREEDMVARFLLGDEQQGFNPISEAKDVLTAPSSEKLEGSEVVNEDITLVGGLNLSMLNEVEPAPVEEAPVVPDAPEMPEPQPEVVVPKATEPVPSPVKKKSNVVNKTKPAAKPLKKQNWLQFVGILGFIILFILVYFRKTIIQHLFQGELTTTFKIIDSAHAQDILPDKKKSF
jgi:outer membrane biosynthesis protein TonB